MFEVSIGIYKFRVSKSYSGVHEYFIYLSGDVERGWSESAEVTRFFEALTKLVMQTFSQ